VGKAFASPRKRRREFEHAFPSLADYDANKTSIPALREYGSLIHGISSEDVIRNIYLQSVLGAGYLSMLSSLELVIILYHGYHPSYSETKL
jgi:hypothetical protein